MQQINKSNSFFLFKNKETEIELRRMISQYEGILPEKVDNYLAVCHSRKRAELVFEAKNYLKAFWTAHKELTLADFVGLINLTLLDIQLDMFKIGDNFIKIIREVRSELSRKNSR